MITDKTPIFLENIQLGLTLAAETAENLEFQPAHDVSKSSKF